MEISLLIFKTVAILHTVAGYIFFAFTANYDLQTYFYAGKNPLTGDILKYLAYFSCCCLIACGIVAFLIPFLAVVLACLSFAFYLSTAIVEAVAARRWLHIGRVSRLSLLLRAIATSILALTMPPSLHG
jgi:hypothetical protein